MRAFVYSILDRGVTPNRWYIGYKIGDFFKLRDSYKTSSKILKPMMIERPGDFRMFLIACGEPSEMRTLESELQMSVNAASNPIYYNRHNGNGDLCSPGGWHHSEKTKKIISAKCSAALQGRILSEAHRRKIGFARIGKAPWNKGIKTGPEPEATRLKKSLARMGKAPGNKGTPCPEYVKMRTREANSGENNPAKREEVRRKISEALKGRVKPWLAEFNRRTKKGVPRPRSKEAVLCVHF